MLYRIYNYPWSGRLGRIATCCIYCGDKGTSFKLSSFGSRCLKCDSNKEPIASLEAELLATYERLAKEWCDRNNIDYQATIDNYQNHLGDMEQDLDKPPKTDNIDYTIYKGTT